MIGTFVGALPFFNDAVDGSAVVQIKSGRGFLHYLKLVNTTGTTAYLQIFKQPAAGVTLGTTTPDWVIRLAANESIERAFVMPTDLGPGATGISIAGTTTPTGSTGAAISVSALYE